MQAVLRYICCMKPPPRLVRRSLKADDGKGEHLGHSYTVFPDEIAPLAFAWTAYVDGKLAAHSDRPAESFDGAMAEGRAAVVTLLDSKTPTAT
jgi:hypothetical protein